MPSEKKKIIKPVPKNSKTSKKCKKNCECACHKIQEPVKQNKKVSRNEALEIYKFGVVSGTKMLWEDLKTSEKISYLRTFLQTFGSL